MNKENIRQARGITLIALVITIIVMLILVSVTISIAVNGGLFNYAKNAAEQTNTKIEEEKNYVNLANNLTYEDLITIYTQNTITTEPEMVFAGFRFRFSDGKLYVGDDLYTGGWDNINNEPVSSISSHEGYAWGQYSEYVNGNIYQGYGKDDKYYYQGELATGVIQWPRSLDRVLGEMKGSYMNVTTTCETGMIALVNGELYNGVLKLDDGTYGEVNVINGVLQGNLFSCLAPDTLVTVIEYDEEEKRKKRKKKKIKDIKVGDYILSFDWNTMELIENKVTYTDADENKVHTEYDKWTFEDGTFIKTVHRHEFYNVEAKRFKYMDEWKIGEHAYKLDGTKVALIKHETICELVQHIKITGEKGTNYFANELLTGDRNCPQYIEI